MLVIRKDQYDALRQARLASFEDEMVSHLSEFSPALFRAVGEPQMRLAIRSCTRRAAEQGFTFRGPVRLYLELMVMFGSDFDADPQYPWAGEILKETGPQMLRAESLFEKAMDFRRTVAGPDDEHMFRALGRVSELGRQPVALPAEREEHVVAVAGLVKDLYPQKAEYLGEQKLLAFVDLGYQKAVALGSRSGLTLALPTVLMLAFGAGCFDDLLYPWIGNTLRVVNPGPDVVVDPEERMNALSRKAMIWLDHVLLRSGGSPTSAPRS
jgi:hypothetical protein